MSKIVQTQTDKHVGEDILKTSNHFMFKKSLFILTLISTVFIGNAQVSASPASDSSKLSAVGSLNRGNQYYDQKNYEDAAKWYQQSANDNNAEGMTSLGYMYANGLGVKADYSVAAKWYIKGAENGNARAMSYIGMLKENGAGVTKNLKEAFTWYTKAANSGNATGMFNLARMYETGTGVSKDLMQALKWYKNAASKYVKQ